MPIISKFIVASGAKNITVVFFLFTLLVFPSSAKATSYQTEYRPQTVEEMIVYLYGMIAQLQAIIDSRSSGDSYEEIGVVRKSSSKNIDVDTLNPKNVRDDEADLRGRVDLEDERYANVWFEYGDNKYDLEESTSKRKLYDRDGEVRTFAVNIDDLEEGEKYYYQAVGSDTDGKKSYGSIVSFTTDGSRSRNTGSNNGYELRISDTAIDRGDKITVDWKVPAGDESPSNWIGLYKKSDKDEEYRQYRYIANDTNGTVKFTVSERGEYEFRLFLNNTYDDEVKSKRFDVD
ncbi:hypothetical protein KC865_04190 [Candidatus Kaiserbacteria bacterium]|nr:hypothetical protein [Candidatus Kaiserbacteria bacterium]USN92010.1 MAG: hypothetical protein H6782_03990 [Candidatus Nomurabacteria bacterium]